MPIYEFECLQCGQNMEILMGAGELDLVVCGNCGSRNLKKLISAHASVSAEPKFPADPADRCCGMAGPPMSCAGPGSCCGRGY